MRIAWDVKGTIEGPKGTVILEAFKKLQKLGHECIVWSGLYSYAFDTVVRYDLKAYATSKRTMLDLEDFSMNPYDVAVEDDRSQDYLGAKSFVFVDEIPNNADELVELILSKK